MFEISIKNYIKPGTITKKTEKLERKHKFFGLTKENFG